MSQHPEKASASEPPVKRLLARLSDAYTWPVRTRAALILALHALFVAGFESVYLLAGVESEILGVLPVAISVLLFGVRGGLASATVVSLLDVLVFDRLEGEATNLGDLLNYAILVLVGVVIGC
jgi:hypothetical protein